jgi:hypothetical protein
MSGPGSVPPRYRLAARRALANEHGNYEEPCRRLEICTMTSPTRATAIRIGLVSGTVLQLGAVRL